MGNFVSYDNMSDIMTGIKGKLGGSKSEIMSARCKTIKKSSSAWYEKTWTGLTSFNAYGIWSDGENIYYSNGPDQYVLDKTTSTWKTKRWFGGVLSSFGGTNIWSDGENIYYSNGSTNECVLNKSTSRWSNKTWNGFSNINPSRIWTDGYDIYYSDGDTQYVLNKSTSTWRAKTWSGLTSFSGYEIWSDGENIYRSGIGGQYVLDDVYAGKWISKTWNGTLTAPDASGIWTDGENIYWSNEGYESQFILDKSTSTWIHKDWYGPMLDRKTPMTSYIWSDGENIYYSEGSEQYVLTKPIHIR